VFVSALPPFAVIHARTLCRRVRETKRDAKIVLGLWNSLVPAEKVAERLGQATCQSIVTTLADAQAFLQSAEVPAAVT
jgi:hypothetical protein